jgi:uncharacterized membrane protein
MIEVADTVYYVATLCVARIAVVAARELRLAVVVRVVAAAVMAVSALLVSVVVWIPASKTWPAIGLAGVLIAWIVGVIAGIWDWVSWSIKRRRSESAASN